MFALYLFQGLKFVLWDSPKQKKRDAAKLMEIQRLDLVYKK